MVQQLCEYQITIRGTLDHAALQKCSPYDFTILQKDEQTTTIIAKFDQSGLMGLLRFLHSRSFVLLSIQRFDE